MDSGSHTVYVANNGTSGIVSVINGGTVTATIPFGSRPEGVSVDPGSHTVYVANVIGNTISVMSGGVNIVTARRSLSARPWRSRLR